MKKNIYSQHDIEILLETHENEFEFNTRFDEIIIQKNTHPKSKNPYMVKKNGMLVVSTHSLPKLTKKINELLSLDETKSDIYDFLDASEEYEVEITNTPRIITYKPVMAFDSMYTSDGFVIYWLREDKHTTLQNPESELFYDEHEYHEACSEIVQSGEPYVNYHFEEHEIKEMIEEGSKELI